MIGFTAPEWGIAACLLENMQDKEIARATGISYGMVRRNIDRMMRRFDVFNRRQLAQKLKELSND